ncbi:DNA damage-inducible protein 1 [Emericellopsis cladophorae]|uniref:DNA damage-inducible protein 1 n=1 Tax=Emericellopsis cladophorae TaxID=2686198 RepID=A0A9P9Y7T1_9HYPO|nr:DNA damage-inducible protein 1 [Emericellopsis cladophorae]KAI6785112.1 DNA damage-inducible protein 1 [Emericellopsis cladophorae]
MLRVAPQVQVTVPQTRQDERITLNISNPREGEDDNLITLEVFPEMTVETLRESIHAESKVAPLSQHIYHNGKLLSDNSKTLEQLEIADGEMLAVHVRDMRGSTGVPAQPAAPRQPQQPRPPQGGQAQPDPEMIRLQVLGNPAMRQQVQSQNPDLAAALEEPARFAQILRDSYGREQRERLERQREIERLNDDPFNIDNQRRIEEMIRQERVMENLQNAMEHNPEVFGRVHLLYANVEVNGHKVKALVDSGAQATIMSPDCAEACGISRLIDTRFAGVARGVGTAKIIGRVHAAQIRIGELFLPCSFTVMEGKSVELLLGLDMLKRYQACIDLQKGCLVIQGENIPFLGEAEIPRDMEEQVEGEPTAPGPGGTQIGQRSGAILPAPGLQPEQSSGRSVETPAAPPQQAPALAAPTPTPVSAPAAAPRPSEPGVTEAHVQTLISMGADRARAVQALQASGDNVDMAAGILFFG